MDLFYNSPVRSALALTRLRFTTEQLLLQAERLQVILRELGGCPDQDLLTRLWDLLFTYSGHAMQWLLKEDYDELLTRADLAIAQARLYTQELLLQIAQAAGSHQPDAYILVNPELYARKETVTLVVTTPRHVKGLRLYDQDGNTIPYQILDGYEGDKPYVSKDYNEVQVAFTVALPPMGIRRIYAVNTADTMLPQAQREVFLWAEPINPHTPVELDNGRYCFTVCNGALCRMHDKLDPSATIETKVFGQLRFYKADAQIASGTTWDSWEQGEPAVFLPAQVKYLQRGPELWKLVISGTLYGLAASVTIITKKDSPALHYTFQFDCRGDDGYFAVAFPCKDDPDILAGIPFGAEPRDLSKVGYSEDFHISKEDYLYFERSCDGGFCANRFVSFREGSKRILLTQDDTAYLYRHSRKTHEIETFLMRSVDASSQERLWMRNAHPSRNGVGPNCFSFTASVLDADASGFLQEKVVSRNRFPVLSTAIYFKSPRPVADNRLFRAIPENLTVTACHLQGDALILRLYENSGIGFTGPLGIHDKLREAVLCDLLGQPLQQLSVAGGAIRMQINPWQIVNLRLWFGN